MALLSILRYPDPRLHKVAQPVQAFDARLQQTIDDMFETMYDAKGITWSSPERVKGDEGCLSVPGIYDGVERAVAVKVKALDRHGKDQQIEADGLLAVCIQHEMDHLMGKVFVEYLSTLKQGRIKTKLAKALREEQR